MIDVIALISSGLVAYHHVGHPMALRLLARPPEVPPDAPPHYLRVAIIVPAFQEERRIVAKLRNLAALDHPRERLVIHVLCDGCTDATAGLAREEAERLAPLGVNVLVTEHAQNRGKGVILNEAIASLTEDVIVLTDVSSAVAPDALRLGLRWFADQTISVVGGRYRISPRAQPGERAYWSYQNKIRRLEALAGAPMGVNGAFYLLRRAQWRSTPPDAINDDFVLPMRMVAAGARVALEEAIEIEELEASTSRQDWRRRVRLGAGALQQVFLCRGLLDVRRPRIAFIFASGKGLRAFMPFLLLLALLASFGLLLEGHALGPWLLAPQGLGYGLAALGFLFPSTSLVAFSHAVAGYAAAGVGGARWIMGRPVAWRAEPGEETYVSPAAAAVKRALDVALGLAALIATAVLFIPIAAAIKLDSPGPIFYRQLRVGERRPRYTRLFHLIKFRTMRVDAESKTGPVWSSDQDPRITRVGRFLRKTRLDELPQCLNVLRGDMSVVGPRPERPAFFSKLEAEIPFYVERTYGLKPGITGLAQVTLGYDADIEDVRKKVLHDHAYALRIASAWSCLKADISIILRTVSVMALGKGR
jgi:lipopolysaccharide/colanic/teichoic acid biosynthesis glycosyltransferase